jgi:hypothetical protein
MSGDMVAPRIACGMAILEISFAPGMVNGKVGRHMRAVTFGLHTVLIPGAHQHNAGSRRQWRAARYSAQCHFEI